jgi:ATP-dependent RNA helicase DDX56/DBP9
LLKHDKLLSNKEIPAHLRDVPDYLIDPKTKEASNVVKLSRAAMGIDRPQRRKRQGFKGGSGKSRDPLRTFSAEVHLSISDFGNLNLQFPTLYTPLLA